MTDSNARARSSTHPAPHWVAWIIGGAAVALCSLVFLLWGINGPIYALAYAPKGDMVASAGFEGIVHLNEPTTGGLIRDFVPVPLKGAKK